MANGIQLALVLGSAAASEYPFVRHRPDLVASSSRGSVLSEQRPTLLARRGKQYVEPPTTSTAGNSWLAAGGLAGMALFSEVFQATNSALFLLAMRCFAGVPMAQLPELLVGLVKQLGWAAAPVYFIVLVVLQVLPIMSSLLYIILAGAIFGPVLGTAIVAFAGSCASMIACLIARRIARRYGFGLDRISATAAALDKAVQEQQPSSTLMLLALLRLSPVIPFTFSNYLCGVSSIPALFLGMGTLVGSLPAQVVYVVAGAVGQKAIAGELTLPPAFLAAGVFATVLAVMQVGRLARKALDKVDLVKSTSA